MEFEGVIVKGETVLDDVRKERALLVGVERPGMRWSLESTLDELARLVDTAGAEVITRTTQKLSSLNPKTFVGSGKAEEIAQMCRAYSIDVVVFDDELTPSQQSNLEKTVDKSVKVIDRTALILDIFALHATTKEGRLQVRLAQNQYLLPRLRGMWAHLASNRMGGGVGSRFGEGESQLEVDRRMVRKRIAAIKAELDKLSQVRSVQREERYNSEIFNVSLAGYTNAGKSSLLNALTDAGVLSYDKLFATLDSTTRRYILDSGRAITLTDTVGFIQKLPTTLVNAFQSTLDEISGSNLILHVIDSSSPEFADQIVAVEEVLGQINAQGIARINVFNKCDLLPEDELESLKRRFPQALFISTLTGYGLDDLKKRIADAASASETLMEVLIPYNHGDLVSVAHEKCRVVSERYQEEGTSLTLFVGASLQSRFQPYEQ
ncbi:MAG: GTPase HflX [Eggerthellales bacterium]|nr:GTPase HflX [Eggerthellales bacterium]